MLHVIRSRLPGSHRPRMRRQDFLPLRLAAVLRERPRQFATAGVLAVAAVGVASAAPVAATFPGADGRIAFQAETTNGVQIFTMRADGHGLRQLTHIVPRPDADNPGASLPEWSPDGRRIAFQINDCQIALMNADGSGITLVPPPPGHHPGVDYCEGDVAFLPDGDHIVAEAYDGVLDVDATIEMRVDGSERRVLTTIGGPDPNVSPDGTRLSVKGPGGALFTMNLDGTDVVQITPPTNVAFKHDWAPDGSRIVYSDYAQPDPDQSVNVLTVGPDGSALRSVTSFDDPRIRAYVGSYSPDGKWIVFRLEDRRRPADDGIYALCLIRPDGTGFHRITPFSSDPPRNIDWGAGPHN